MKNSGFLLLLVAIILLLFNWSKIIALFQNARGAQNLVPSSGSPALPSAGSALPSGVISQGIWDYSRNDFLKNAYS